MNTAAPITRQANIQGRKFILAFIFPILEVRILIRVRTSGHFRQVTRVRPTGESLRSISRKVIIVAH